MLADELHRADVGDDARSMVDSIGREVARLAELTERYLSMARSDDPKREPTDVGALVDDAVRRLRAELLAEGVTASVVCDGTVQCSVDDPQLRQVVVNLVRNAVQALRGSEDKRIRVVVAPTAGRGATVTVEDSGPGVQADMAARLFEPFVSGRDGGTGLGLSISRRIARRHGGDLTAGASLELGGAMFTLSLEPTAAAVREATEAADSD
ncbi:MAG: HAMP domain-containing histidine kinase [Myxococcales bacterium]|nr:HAMP domain-containing histidine kinase [Myxococcales bacterium]